MIARVAGNLLGVIRLKQVWVKAGRQEIWFKSGRVDGKCSSCYSFNYHILGTS